jgi:hypothetical protein
MTLRLVPAGGPTGWETLSNGPLGDLRGTYPGHDIYQERVGDYVYAAAASCGLGVWADARSGFAGHMRAALRGLSTLPQSYSLTPCDQRLAGPRLSGLASGWWRHPMVKAMWMDVDVSRWGWAAPPFGQIFKAGHDS